MRSRCASRSRVIVWGSSPGTQLLLRLGKIDVWVNDAMETVFSRVSDMTAQEFRRVTEVTYLGFVHGTMAARSEQARPAGAVVSVATRRVQPVAG